MIAFMNATETHQIALYLIGEAQESVFLKAFTYDLASVTDALIAAASRGVATTVATDDRAALTGSTAHQLQRLEHLREGGVAVLLTKGADLRHAYGEVGRAVGPGTGIQHSKTLLIDGQMAIVGSVNWTTSSRANHEMAVLTQLTTAGADSWKIFINRLKILGRPLDHDIAEQATARRELRRSKSQDAHRTARRFSIARRSQTASLLEARS